MRKIYDVFSVTNCEHPTRLIGVAEEHGDEAGVQTRNSIFVVLDAFPVSGKFVLHERKEKKEADRG